METAKILVLLTYYDRPELVRGFLRSLIAANRLHQNWHLAFIDDGSAIKGRPIAERILGELACRVDFVDTGMTPGEKKLCGGSYIGHYMNEAVRASDADLIIMAGDDDEMCADYLSNLAWFFSTHPGEKSCYSNAYVFDPLKEIARDTSLLYSDDPAWKGHAWFGKPIDCSMKVDGIQVAARRSCFVVDGAWFEAPIRINHDALFFRELHDRCGPSPYSGFVGMWKGRHAGQLVRRPDMASGVIDKPRPRLMA